MTGQGRGSGSARMVACMTTVERGRGGEGAGRLVEGVLEETRHVFIVADPSICCHPRPISITYTSMHAGTRALAANTHTHTFTHAHTEPASRRGRRGAHYGLEPLLALCACRRRGTRGQAEWGVASGGSEWRYGVPKSSEMPRGTPTAGAPSLPPPPRSDSSALLLPAASAAPGTSANPTGPCCMPKRLPPPPPAPSPSEPHCLELHKAAC